MKSTVKPKGNKKSFNWYLNLLLVVTLVLIVILASILGYINFRQSRVLDLSHQYSVRDTLQTDVTDTGKPQMASAFASDLCVSEGSANLELLTLTSNTEKALLFNLDTNTPVFSHGIYDRVYPASITKIMTALMVMKYGNMSDEVTITAEDVTLEEGSQVSGMQAGDKTSMESLFKALMVYSANDAAMAIAEHIGGSVAGFAEMMNQEAKNLGMTGTNFVNPHGLHDDNHYTTCYDIYLMLNAAYQYPEFYDAMQMKVYTLNVTRADGSPVAFRLDSTDKYLTGEKSAPKNVTVIGGKTGTTGKAGACLAILTQNAYGQPFVSIVMNAATKNTLYNDMNLLLEQINS